MNQSKIENGQPEQLPNNEQEAEILPSAQVSANALVGGSFHKGDKIIWDSHFGYEIGYFVEECQSQYDKYVVDLWSGKVGGEVAHPKSEIFKFSDELISELSEKYGYKKCFLNYEIKKRERPILGVLCPICGSVFSVQAFHTDFFNENDHEENARIVKELMEYAMQGLNIKIFEGGDYDFNYCAHVKSRMVV